MDGKDVYEELESKTTCRHFISTYLFSSLLLIIVPCLVVIVNFSA